jgi:SAM-dependent methyltransferase
MSAEAFRSVLARDRELGRLSSPRLIDWTYITKSRTIEDRERLFSYDGPHHLRHWITGHFAGLDAAEFEPRPIGYWQRPAFAPQIDALIERSSQAHEQLLAAAELEAPPGIHAAQDVYNAQDFYYCTAFGTGIKTILDYGAGYGRQAMLFSTTLEGASYIAVDAVEQSYVLQQWVFRALGLDLLDYIDEPAITPERVDAELRNGRQALHLPSWRLDLLPDGSVDLAMFVWSLHEMSEDAARAAVRECGRVIRRGGYLYIRDGAHEFSFRGGADRFVRAAGFELVAEPHRGFEGEVHGQVRLYRSTGMSPVMKARRALASGARTARARVRR